MTKKNTARRPAPASRSIDAEITAPSDWRGELLSRIRALVTQADPEIVEERKWKSVQSDGRPGVVAPRDPLHG